MARTSATARHRNANAQSANAASRNADATNLADNVANASPTPFTISPADSVRGVLDFNKKEHVKVFQNASAKLYPDGQTFDVVENQLHDFLAVLRSRAIKYGWNMGIMLIPSIPALGNDSEKKNILESHGTIPLSIIRQHEMLYMNAESRERQDMECLYNCIMASLSSEGRTRVLTEREKFVITDDKGKEHESGNLLLKVVIDKSSVDNYSGAYAIQMELNKLPELLSQLKFDVTKFNERVKSLTLSLGKMGKTSDDLPFNLIRAYKTVPVTDFKSAIERLRDDWENSPQPEQYTDVRIMDRAENKFRSLRKEGAWKVQESEEDKILALETKIKKLEKANRNLTKKGGNKKSNKTTKKKTSSTKLDITRKPRDITKPITFKGKKFWWCSAETGGKCNGALRRHKPSECKGAEFLKGKKDEKLVAEEAEIDHIESDVDNMSF